jgi:hypothetical protein
MKTIDPSMKREIRETLIAVRAKLRVALSLARDRRLRSIGRSDRREG